METVRKEYYISQIDKLEAQYKASSSLPAHTLYSVWNNIFNGSYKTSMCGPCARHRLNELINWRNNAKLEMEQLRNEIVAIEQSVIEKAIQVTEDYAKQTEKPKRGRRKSNKESK